MNNYQIIRAVGKGSFGKVYQVRHKGEGRHYCCKQIKLTNIPRKERDSCRSEIRLMQKLRHPNIVGYKVCPSLFVLASQLAQINSVWVLFHLFSFRWTPFSFFPSFPFFLPALLYAADGTRFTRIRFSRAMGNSCASLWLIATEAI